MSVEQRLHDAFTDLEAMLNEGRGVADAVKECAGEYGFQPDVLKMRAERAFGDLASLRVRNVDRAARAEKEHLAETAIDLFLVDKPEENFPTWFENRVGRPPTSVESKDFGDRYIQHLLRNLKFEI